MIYRVSTLLAIVFLFTPDEPVDDKKKELESLQGEWTMVSNDISGIKIPDSVAQKTKLTIKGDKWSVIVGNTEDKDSIMTIKVDSSKKPKTIDFSWKSGDEANITLGIYKLDGDTLMVCRSVVVDSDRPGDFKTMAKDGRSLMVWKRTKK